MCDCSAGNCSSTNHICSQTDIQKWNLATGEEIVCNNVGGFARNQVHFSTSIKIGGLMVNTFGGERNKKLLLFLSCMIVCYNIL